jgi:DNA polymerase
METNLLEHEILDWYITAGVDEIIGEVELDYYKINQVEKLFVTKKNNELDDGYKKDVKSLDKNIIDVDKQIEKITSLEDLNEFIKTFEGCSLKKTAKNTVLGDGNPNSDILIIAQSPGADEDRTGEILAGRDGDLLDKILKTINISRQDCYVSNIIPWRAPGNRKPTEKEIQTCLPFIKKTIELIKPNMIILLGVGTYNALTGEQTTISKIRGSFKIYQEQDKKIKMITTFHPSYLLQSPLQKAKAWKDFLKVLANI